MTGTTFRGIRYPDGASKAVNLGAELKTMADDIDTYLFFHAVPGAPGAPGAPGTPGAPGAQGIPSPLAVANDDTTAGLVSTTGTSATQRALDARYGRRTAPPPSPAVSPGWAVDGVSAVIVGGVATVSLVLNKGAGTLVNYDLAVTLPEAYRPPIVNIVPAHAGVDAGVARVYPSGAVMLFALAGTNVGQVIVAGSWAVA